MPPTRARISLRASPLRRGKPARSQP
jgi:hypothetical protein